MEEINMKRDARSLSHETLYELRLEIVRRRLAGESRNAVAVSMQMNVTTISKIFSKYKHGGLSALESTKAPGPKSKLTFLQQRRLKKYITTKNPNQLQFSFALWTLPIVSELIQRKFGVVLHETTISRMLKRMGITPQRPVRQAFKRNDEECRIWAQEEFPEIVKQYLKKQGILLFLDEAGIHEDGPVAHTWAERGKTPVVKVTGTRRKVNVISAISPRGQFWFRCYTGNLTAPKFVEFLKGLLHDMKGQIFLILDRHPSHTAASTRRFLQDNEKRIHAFYLPGYAPDLNPDEHVWSYLKGLFRREPLHEDEEFFSSVFENAIAIKQDPELVKSFFGNPSVAYVKEALNWK